ncbi:sensor histidine kinase [Roseibium salinum]|uniref:Oxygen sensor histidine kinase NreB n=1 Tax=Roseibium salinum TaxID=1604349 RepID=A0ABT3QX19_9HYPH|nr:sensor histidine kinase [Roseibium sp. DSM 29163]MCX2721485.1 sensor histidine kinase [Roseibium sp. DSM 29163]
MAGGVVSIAAMILIGAFVTSLIQDSVIRNSAAATARYVDSVIAPLLPDMQRSAVIGDPVRRALDETLGQGALGDRLASFILWSPDGKVLYSNDRRLIGQRYELSNEIRAAFRGRLVADFRRPAGLTGNEAQAAGSSPTLEIYNPVLQPWSGEVVAVSEFQEIASDFEYDLRQARAWSWLAVASVIAGFFLVLSAIVFRGSRLIDRQSHALRERVSELLNLLAQNRALRVRVQRASQRTAALNERYLRRIGADLHDGPAQLLALAALKLDSAALSEASASSQASEREVSAIKSALQDAMHEIRTICQGLVLPQVEAAELKEILRLAVRTHEQRTGRTVRLSMSGTSPALTPSEKICIYRFLQETLNNSYRHAGGIGQAVTQTADGGRITVEVSDRGPGFDPADMRSDGLGLTGLHERVESLGGRFEVSSSDKGTTVRMSLAIEEMESL